MSLSEGIRIIVRWVLQYDHAEFAVWRNHNFMLVGPNPDEGDVFFWVESFDRIEGFSVELSNEGAILDSFGLGHS